MSTNDIKMTTVPDNDRGIISDTSTASVVRDLASMRKISLHHKKEGYHISFVPTMGALHGGHLKLFEEAREKQELENYKVIVIASIFVNPKQFNRSDDYQHYPRTFEMDVDKCRAAKVNYVFAPDAEDMFPSKSNQSCCMVVADDYLGQVLEGESRPGHLSGMLTVVTKLLNIIQPDSAFFGIKDYQQLLLVTRLVRDLNISTVIRPVETVREDNGCALSSRNRLLNEEQRGRAIKIYKILIETKSRLIKSRIPFDCRQVLNEVLAELDPNKSLIIDYFEVRCAQCLNCISCQDETGVKCRGTCVRGDGLFEAILLIACYVDTVRLLDSLKIKFVS